MENTNTNKNKNKNSLNGARKLQINNASYQTQFNTIHYTGGVCYYNSGLCVVFAHKVTVVIVSSVVITNGELRKLTNAHIDCLLSIRGAGYSAEGKANAVEQLVNICLKQL